MEQKKWKNFKDSRVTDQRRLQRLMSSVDENDYLTRYMKEHTFIAKKQITKLGPLGYDLYLRKWSDLAKDLNIISGVQKSVKQWQDKWTRMRLKAKEEMCTYLKCLRKTGNNYVAKSSDQCERISNIFGKFGVSCSVVPEVGLASNSKDDADQFVTQFFTSLSRKREQEIAKNKESQMDAYSHSAELPFNRHATELEINRRNSQQTQIMVEFLLERDREAMAFGGNLQNPAWKELTRRLNKAKPLSADDRSIGNWQHAWRYFKIQGRMKCKVYAKGDKTCKKPNNLQWRVFYAEKDYNQRFGAEIGSFDYDEEAENATPNASASKQLWDSPILPKKMKSNKCGTSKQKYSIFDELSESSEDDMRKFKRRERLPLKSRKSHCMDFDDEYDFPRESRDHRTYATTSKANQWTNKPDKYGKSRPQQMQKQAPRRSDHEYVQKSCTYVQNSNSNNLAAMMDTVSISSNDEMKPYKPKRQQQHDKQYILVQMENSEAHLQEVIENEVPSWDLNNLPVVNATNGEQQGGGEDVGIAPTIGGTQPNEQLLEDDIVPRFVGERLKAATEEAQDILETHFAKVKTEILDVLKAGNRN